MGLEHVETIVANNQPTVDFTNVFDDSANRYRIFVDNFIPSDDPTRLHTRMSSDGGSTWDSGSSDYAYSVHGTEEDGTTFSFGSGSSDKIESIIQNASNDPTANDTSLSTIIIHDPFSSNRSTVIRTKQSKYRNGSSAPFNSLFSGGQRLAQSSVDSIRMFVESGDISSGIFSVYKITQTTGGAKQHIKTIEADNQSSVDFTGVFQSDDGYDRYQIYADNVIPRSDDHSLQVQFSSDGGSTWDDGTSDYAHASFRVDESGGTGTDGSSSDSKIQVGRTDYGNAANDTAGVRMFISNPTNSARATVTRFSISRYRDGAGNSMQADYGGGIRLSQSSIDSLRFFFDGDDIASGTFSVYGIGE